MSREVHEPPCCGHRSYSRAIVDCRPSRAIPRRRYKRRSYRTPAVPKSPGCQDHRRRFEEREPRHQFGGGDTVRTVRGHSRRIGVRQMFLRLPGGVAPIVIENQPAAGNFVQVAVRRKIGTVFSKRNAGAGAAPAREQSRQTNLTWPLPQDELIVRPKITSFISATSVYALARARPFSARGTALTAVASWLRMNASVRSRASWSVNCCGGDFIK